MAHTRSHRHSTPKSDTVRARLHSHGGGIDTMYLAPQLCHMYIEKPPLPHRAMKKVTRWCYYHEGDVDIPEICVYSIDNRCSFEDKGCSRLHAKCTSQWQVMYKSNWYNLRNFHSKELEDGFENVTETGVELSIINPAKLGTAGSGMFKILGNYQWVADFDTLLLKRKDSPSTVYKIRRLSTQSAAVSRSAKATTYVWYFLDVGNNWIKYGEQDSSKNHCVSSVTSDDIEKQYCNDKSTSLNFTASEFKYRLNLETMEQLNLKTNKVRPVRRRPIKKLSTKPLDKGSKDLEKVSVNQDLPSIWKEMKETDTMHLVPLESSSQEYKDAMSQMLLTLPGARPVSVKRVQNPFIWRTFKNKKNEMSIKYGNAGKVNVQKLFHGTKEEYIINICKENFDWRLHGTNVGQYYGRGTYFSNSAATSRRYCTPNASGHSFMFISEVILGEITVGNSTMARPPRNPATDELFDTTVDNILTPKVFVKYDKQEYCPVYVIEFI